MIIHRLHMIPITLWFDLLDLLCEIIKNPNAIIINIDR